MPLSVICQRPFCLPVSVPPASKSGGSKNSKASYQKVLDTGSLQVNRRMTNANPPAGKDGGTPATKKNRNFRACPPPLMFAPVRRRPRQKIADGAEAKHADLHSPLRKHQTEEGIYDYFYCFHFQSC